MSRSELDTKDSLLLNRQIKKSECSFISAPVSATIAVAEKVINIGPTATFAEYDFSVVQDIYNASASIIATFASGQENGDADTNFFNITIINTTTQILY